MRDAQTKVENKKIIKLYPSQNPRPDSLAEDQTVDGTKSRITNEKWGRVRKEMGIGYKQEQVQFNLSPLMTGCHDWQWFLK